MNATPPSPASPALTPRGTLRATGLAIAYLAAYFLVTMFVQFIVALVLTIFGASFSVLRTPEILTKPLILPIYFASLVGIVGVTWGFCRWLDGRSLLDLGLRPKPGWLSELGLGFAIGALLMTLILVAELALGGYQVQSFGWQVDSPGQILSVLLVTFVLFVMASLAEELGFRGYVLQCLERGWDTAIALFASSAVFAAFHATNQNASAISALSLVVAGLLLGSAYLLTRALWLPIGLHLAWNFFQGPIFGFPVSGNAVGGLLRITPVGPTYLSGGGFGPEASLIGVTVELLGVALLWLWAIRRGGTPLTAR